MSEQSSREVPYLWRARCPEDTPEGPIDMLLLPVEGVPIQLDNNWVTTIVTWESNINKQDYCRDCPTEKSTTRENK